MGHEMNKNVKGATIVCLALVLGLAACGKKAPATDTPTDEGATIQEQVTSEIEDKTTQAEGSADATALPEGFTTHETSYLTMGIAPGWTADPNGIAEEEANAEMGEGYLAHGLDVVNDETGSQILVMVFQAAEFPEPIEDPQVNDHILSVEDAKPITVGGVELTGYLTTISTGSSVAEWFGTVNGHFVDILAVDYSEDVNLRTSDTVSTMLESITIK